MKNETINFTLWDMVVVCMFLAAAAVIAIITFSLIVYPTGCSNKYWNITEEARVKRECILACSGFDIYIPVMTKDACVCCDEDVNIEPYSKCIYFSLELNTTTG